MPSDLAVALEANVAPESLYREFNDGDKSGGYLIDKIANNIDTEEEVLDKISLGEAIKALDERERKIIMLRYFRGKNAKRNCKCDRHFAGAGVAP
ncbi:MAG: hypothetical protein L6V93_06715 [Clostridiales bacterium]|nr:MAG: hypothetical protein L6V93_06715 [Clostridiales bacterium]